MLFPIYKSIKDRLASQVTDLKDIQWFNDQYAGIIHAEPIALIEFPDGLDIEAISKQSNRSLSSIRVHVISKSVSDSDDTISDSQVEKHEILVALVIAALNYYTPVSDTSVALGSKLIHTQYRSVHDYNGWLVTWLTFTTKIPG
jgi:hypothetical protein